MWHSLVKTMAIECTDEEYQEIVMSGYSPSKIAEMVLFSIRLITFINKMKDAGWKPDEDEGKE